MVRFAFSGKASVSVTAAKDFKTVKIRPLSRNVAFHQKMRDRGVKSEFRVRNGVHNWEYWHLSLRQALPFATRNFTK